MPSLSHIIHKRLPHPIGNVEYVYRDDHIIVVDKPANMLSVPGKTPEKQDCLIHRVQQRFPEARIVHRLDFSTSGLMVIARNPESHRELSRQFQDRETKKTYIAKVYGHPEKESGEVNVSLRCDLERRPLQIIDHKYGKAAQTFWQILERHENSCSMELIPVTGRTHQLRVHMQALGHPILGDELYGHEAASALADRLFLHARKLTITHPTDNNRLTFLSAIEPF
jgi:tRNA pseudouridine32 synthase / 23S rRNA pseudouridine746 synthase